MLLSSSSITKSSPQREILESAMSGSSERSGRIERHSNPEIWLLHSVADRAWVTLLLNQLEPPEREHLRLINETEMGPAIDDGLSGRRVVVLLLMSERLLKSVSAQSVRSMIERLEELQVPWNWVALNRSADNPLSEWRDPINETALVELSPLKQEVQLGKISAELARPSEEARSALEPVEHPSEQHFVHGLTPHRHRLYDRDAALDALDAAWSDPSVGLLVLEGESGFGKSVLLESWLTRLMQRSDPVERTFAWRVEPYGPLPGMASADQLLAAALSFFNDPRPLEGAPTQRGRRLAERLSQGRNLLIIDELELLQHEGLGALRELSLSALCTTAARQGEALLVVATRQAPPELLALGSGVQRITLERLTPDAEVRMLHDRCPSDPDWVRTTVSVALQGHPMALDLLSRYQAEYRDHQALDPDVVASRLRADSSRNRLIELMQEIAKHLPVTDLSLLRLLALFDRSVHWSELRLLISPPLLDLTDPLTGLSERDLSQAWQRLKRVRLVEGERQNLRCHPLIVESLRPSLPAEATQEAHRRLFNVLKRRTDHALRVDELELVYRTIAHGAQGGLQRDALIYYHQAAAHGKTGHSIHKLGAYAGDLAALTILFEQPYSETPSQFDPTLRTALLYNVSAALRACGRVDDAVAPAEAALRGHLQLREWAKASRDASSVSDLHLRLGNLTEALRYASQAVVMADKVVPEHQLLRRAALAQILVQMGRNAEAMKLLPAGGNPRQALRGETLSVTVTLLFSDCLLANVEPIAWAQWLSGDKQKGWSSAVDQSRRVIELALAALAADKRLPKGDFSFLHLVLARAYLMEEVLKGVVAFTESRQSLEYAFDGITREHHQQLLPLLLLTRAAVTRCQARLPDQSMEPSLQAEAEADLNEALLIATHGPMPLYQVDIALEQARLLIPKRVDEALAPLTRAQKLVQKHGYLRRERELKELWRAYK